jgi:putative addiction module component (TIGR02574 family)
VLSIANRIISGFFKNISPENPAMHENAKSLCDQARKLSPIERLELVDGILASLDEPDAVVDQLWADEAEDRLAAYRRGEMKAVPLETVLAKYRQP